MRFAQHDPQNPNLGISTPPEWRPGGSSESPKGLRKDESSKEAPF